MQRFSDSPVTHGQHGKVLRAEERPGQHLRAVCSYTGDKLTEPWAATGTDISASLARDQIGHISLVCWIQGYAYETAASRRAFEGEGGVSFGRWNATNQYAFQVLKYSVC